jgi:hypothetical protein
MLMTTPAAARPEGRWDSYANARFGTRTEIPVHEFEVQPPPANGDGRTFRSKDGAEIRVYGSYGASVVTETFEEYKGWLLNNLQEEGVQVTYKAGGKGWMAYSGLKGSTVIYYKVIEGCGASHTVFAEYPQTLKAKYDPIVSRVARSLQCRTPVRQHTSPRT